MQIDEEDSEILEKRVEDRLKERRLFLPNKKQIRNLKQYKDLSDEEFNELIAKKEAGIIPEKVWEQRIESKMSEFGESYDLSDLKINDVMTLRSLAAAVIRLDDFESILNKITSAGVTENNILVIDKIGKLMSDLRTDISKMQDDLKIARKTRKGDKEASMIETLEKIKTNAKRFVEQKMFQIFCPKCNMLLASLWTLYPTGKNKIILTCNRHLQDGSICGEVVTITSKELLEAGGNNKQDLPETLK